MAGQAYRESKKSVRLSFSLQERGKYILRAKDSVNCDCHTGGLKSGVGGSKLYKKNGSPHTCPVDNVISIVARKDLNDADQTYTERFGALTSDGKFYIEETFEGEYFCIFTGVHNAEFAHFAGENNRYNLALINPHSCVYIKQDNTTGIMVLDHACGVGCFYEHRMFLGEKPSTLLCSAPEDILNFTPSIHDGGLIRFPNVGGALVAMKGFRERLYLFFEYGILRLNAAGAVKNFTADTLTYSGGKIYGKTVCVGNQGIYFLAADGAYRFDGEKAHKLLDGFTLPASEETKLERGAAYGGRIFFRYLTEKGYLTLVVYEDGESGYYMDGLPIFTGSEGGRCLFIDENDVICSLTEGGEFGWDGTFQGAETDLGKAGRKTLTGLCFEGKGSFVLTVKTAGRTLRRELTFKDGRAEIKTSERGERFTFDFQLPYGAEISSMTASYTTVTGG